METLTTLLLTNAGSLCWVLLTNAGFQRRVRQRAWVPGPGPDYQAGYEETLCRYGTRAGSLHWVSSSGLFAGSLVSNAGLDGRAGRGQL